MPRIDCNCGHALILDTDQQTTCPRCGCLLTPTAANPDRIDGMGSTLADLTPTTPGEVDEAARAHVHPPSAIEVERPPIRLNYATDGRPTPPEGSSLIDPYDRASAPSRFRWRDWIVPLISARAMAISMFLVMPLSCFGLTASAVGTFAGCRGFTMADLNPVAIVGFVFCLPNVILYLIEPSLYAPVTNHVIVMFYTIQFFYFYCACLLVARLLKRWLGE